MYIKIALIQYCISIHSRIMLREHEKRKRIGDI